MRNQSTQTRLEIKSPFAQLNAFLEGIEAGMSAIDLTIGEPKHGVPDFVAPILAENIAAFQKYPPIRGTAELRQSIATWANQRFSLEGFLDADKHVLPLAGSREGLFYALLLAKQTGRHGPEKPKILIPNPYYPVYAAGADALDYQTTAVECKFENQFMPELSAVEETDLREAAAIFIASPANPQGGTASLDYWVEWLEAAQKHDFLLFADECYSEIYRNTPPVGALEAAKKLGNMRNLLVFNSLSKRSNLAGMRCGFVIGDADLIEPWAKFRNMAGPQMPLPHQAVSVAALQDEAHVEHNRALYNEKYAVASERLGSVTDLHIPEGGFFLWLDVSTFGTGRALTEKLWQKAGVRVIPGEFLCADNKDGTNDGDPYIRIAMVESLDQTKEALQRIVDNLK